jgi:hypothetical protein
MSIVSRDLKILCDAIATQYCGVLFMLSWLRVFTREPTAHLGHRGGPER